VSVPPAPAAARTATVAVLLAVAVIGLRARGAFSHQAGAALANAGGQVIGSVFAVAEGAGLVACVIVFALVPWRPRRRKPEDEAQEQWRPPLPWWAKTVAVLFALTMLAAPWIILLATGEPAFRPGPVFTGLLLADEINRTPPKTQAALLEAMAEGQVSADGVTRLLPSPFVVLATDNPIEYEGTYPLPEAQLDRFIARVRLGYLDAGGEAEMVRRRLARGSAPPVPAQVTDATRLLAMRESLEQVRLHPDLLEYVVALVAATRAHPQVTVGASPRGTLAVVQLARGRAALAGRGYVTPEDIKTVAVPALAHRLVLRPEMWVRQVTGEDVTAEVLATVPVPRSAP